MTSTHAQSKNQQANPVRNSQGTQSQGTQSQVINSKGTFDNGRSLKLFYQSWYPTQPDPDVSKDSSNSGDQQSSPPKPQIKGVVAIVHGIGEHSGRYSNVVQALTATGYAVYSFDNQGHGKSEGQRGHIDHWQDYRDNTQRFLQLVRQHEATAPLFLMGHSLGGLIVLEYVLRNAQTDDFKALAIRGIIISAPPIEPVGGNISQPRILLARLLSGLFPRLSLNMGIDEHSLSRDQTVVGQIGNDPLIHSRVTLKWGTETLDAINWVTTHINQLQLPILLTHGGADPISTPAGSRKIFQCMETADKTLTIYPDRYHEPHNDLDAQEVVTDLVRWLNEQLGKG